MKRVIETSDAPRAIGAYSQAIAANNFVFTSGQIPLDPISGELVGDDIKTQTKRVLENLSAVLEASGSDLAHVVKTTVFLRDMNDFANMNEIYATFFGDNPPARSTVEAARLPRDVRVEIEAIGLVKDSGG